MRRPSRAAGRVPGWAGAALATVAVAVGIAAPAAAESPAFSITPVDRRPYYVLGARPGQVLSGRVRVVNVSGTPGSVQLSAVDATTGETTGAVYLSSSAPRRDVGRWIALAATQITLGPHRATVVGFSVRVPTSARSGQHLGGIVAAPLEPTASRVTSRGRRTFHVIVREISIVAVQVDLPGPAAQQMVVSGVTASGRPGYQTVQVGLGNTGSSLVKGRGQLTILDSAGRRVLDQTFAIDTFVPQTSIAYPVYVRGAHLPPGSYRAIVAISYGQGHRLARTFPLPVSSRQVRQTYGTTAPDSVGTAGGRSPGSPVWLIALGGVILLGAGVGGSALYFRRRYAASGES